MKSVTHEKRKDFLSPPLFTAFSLLALYFPSKFSPEKNTTKMREKEVWVTKDGYGLVGMVYSGARIDAITPGSGAYHAGVERGMHILEVDGRRVDSTNSIAGALSSAPHRFLLKVGSPEEYQGLDPPETVARYQQSLTATLIGRLEAELPPQEGLLSRRLSPTRRPRFEAVHPHSQQMHIPPQETSVVTDLDRSIRALQLVEESKRYTTLAERLEALEKKAEETDVAMAEIKAELEMQRTRADSAEKELATVQESVGQIDSSVNVPPPSATTDVREEKVHALQGRLLSLEDAIGALSGNLSGVLSNRQSQPDLSEIIARLDALEAQHEPGAPNTSPESVALHAVTSVNAINSVHSVNNPEGLATNTEAVILQEIAWLKERCAHGEASPALLGEVEKLREEVRGVRILSSAPAEGGRQGVDEDLWLELRNRIAGLKERQDGADLRVDASLEALEQVNRALRQLNERVGGMFAVQPTPSVHHPAVIPQVSAQEMAYAHSAHTMHTKDAFVGAYARGGGGGGGGGGGQVLGRALTAIEPNQVASPHLSPPRGDRFRNVHPLSAYTAALR